MAQRKDSNRSIVNVAANGSVYRICTAIRGGTAAGTGTRRHCICDRMLKMRTVSVAMHSAMKNPRPTKNLRNSS